MAGLACRVRGSVKGVGVEHVFHALVLSQENNKHQLLVPFQDKLGQQNGRQQPPSNLQKQHRELSGPCGGAGTPRFTYNTGEHNRKYGGPGVRVHVRA